MIYSVASPARAHEHQQTAQYTTNIINSNVITSTSQQHQQPKTLVSINPFHFSLHLQIHVSIIGLDPTQQLVVISDIDQDLQVPSYSFVEHAEGPSFQVRVVGCFWFIHI